MPRANYKMPGMFRLKAGSFYLLANLLVSTLVPGTAATAADTPLVIPRPQQSIRPLPGGLNQALVFNSNSPEVVKTPGILLSTFPGTGAAHLHMPLKGQVDFFLHHINNSVDNPELKTLYLAVLLKNPGKNTVTIKISQAASYLSQPEAPFISLPALVDNAAADIYAGPGDRVMSDFLRGQKQPGWPRQIRLKPQQSTLLFNLPIPVSALNPPINGRTTLIRTQISGPVYAASLAAFTAAEKPTPPSLEDWQKLLIDGNLCGPREKPPTVPESAGPIVYGRVAGVARGNLWQTTLCDCACSRCQIKLPPAGQELSYVISSLEGGTFGTGQIQSAPLVVRYPDTAYKANGNYGVKYDLLLPLFNNSGSPQTAEISLQSPLKSDEHSSSLDFYDTAPSRVFFRGLLRFSFSDASGRRHAKYVHLVGNRGQRTEPLLSLPVPPQQSRNVRLELYYPPDATPPQVLTISTK